MKNIKHRVEGNNEAHTRIFYAVNARMQSTNNNFTIRKKVTKYKNFFEMDTN